MPLFEMSFPKVSRRGLVGLFSGLSALIPAGFAKSNGNKAVTDSTPAGGLALYPQTAAEAAAAITPVNYAHPSGNPYRYGAKGDGVADDGAALVSAQSLGLNVTYDDGVFFVGTDITLTGTHRPNGGKIWVSCGVTLTVNCIIVGDTRLFICGPGTISFGREAKGVGGWKPEWFGGKASQVNPTGSITTGTASLVVSSTTDLEIGAGISVSGAGLAPAAPGIPALVNNAGSGRAYTIAIAAVHYNSGISAASSGSIHSGATPNISATWTASDTPGVVLYLVYVNGVLVGSTPNLTYPIGTAAASGILFVGCPATEPSRPIHGWLTSIIQTIVGTTVTLASNARATTVGQTVRLDASRGLQTCQTAADAAYGFGGAVGGGSGWRTNAIVFDTGVYNLSIPIIAKGMFSYNGQGGMWNTGSSLVKNQIYANAIIVQGCTADGLSVGCSFDKMQFVEANIAFQYTPIASNYFFRFLGWNGTAAYNSNSIYFLDGTRFSTINAIWLSHGDDWKISSVFDAGLNFVHQQLDVGLTPNYQWDFKFVGVQGYQPANFAIYATSVSSGLISGCMFNNVSVAGISTGNNASAIVRLQPGAGSSISNVTITGNSFQNTRTVLMASKCSAVTFANNAVGGLVGTGLLFDACHHVMIQSCTWAFQSGQKTGFIVFDSGGGTSTHFQIDGVFDMTNTSAGDAISTTNAAATNTVLTASTIKGRVIGTARLIDWVDMASEIDVTVTHSFMGGYPTAHSIGTFSAVQGTSTAMLAIEWNTSIRKTGISTGAESGTANLLLAQASTAAAAQAAALVGSPTRVGATNPAGTADATPTTTFTIAAPGTAGIGALALTVTCPAAAADMAGPTLVSSTVTLRSKGQPSAASGASPFAMKLG
jgi:hypothetical protein